MLLLTYKAGEMITFILPDGHQIHTLITSLSEGRVRIAYEMPDAVKITRDSIGAARAFKDFKP